MKIIKYQKKGNNNYQVFLDNDKKYLLNEDVILKYKLLYKEEIDEFLLDEILQANANYDIYNKCVKYISVRLRSINEIKEFMQRKNVSSELIEETIQKLLSKKLLDDDIFAKAFVNDKLNFTTMGPYRIAAELKIDNGIITKYIDNIDDKYLEDKINKQIMKLLKSNKNKPNLKSKIYNNLLNLGYTQSMILDNLDKYDLN